MKDRGIRRYQAESHMNRRLKEDRNQHYNDLSCPCYTNPKAMARFKEQPTICSGPCCGNQRKWAKGKEKLTTQELRWEGIGQEADIEDSVEKAERSALST